MGFVNVVFALSHFMRNAVEGQKSCSLIHIYSYFGGAWGYSETCLFEIVPEWELWGRAKYIPRLAISTECRFWAISLSVDILIWYCYIHSGFSTPTPVNLSVTASMQILVTQYLTPVFKSVWIIRIQLECQPKKSVFSSERWNFLPTVLRSRVNWSESNHFLLFILISIVNSTFKECLFYIIVLLLHCLAVGCTWA